MADVIFDLDKGRTDVVFNLGKRTSTYIPPAEVKKEKNLKGFNRYSGKCAELKERKANILELRDRYSVDSEKWIEWNQELATVNRTLDKLLKEMKNPTREVTEEERLTKERDEFPEDSDEWQKKDEELTLSKEKKKRGY